MRLLALIVAASPVLVWAQGPIETRNFEPTSLAFLRFTPRGDLLAPGERALSVAFGSANALRFDGTFREDEETERLALRMAWGVARGEWRIEIPFLARGGGFQDPLIDAFHQLLGIGKYRGTVPYGRTELQLGTSGSFGSELGLGDVVGTFSRPFGPQASFSVALKLPTGNAGGLLGSGAVDGGAAVNARWKLARRLNGYGQAGVVFQGAPTRFHDARRVVDQEALTLEYVANSRDFYTAQWQSEPAAIQTGNAFSDGPHRQVSLGYARRLSSRDSLQAYFNEDGDFLNYRVPELVDIAPDFTIGLNWTRRF